jgi:hypothetical protein
LSPLWIFLTDRRAGERKRERRVGYRNGLWDKRVRETEVRLEEEEGGTVCLPIEFIEELVWSIERIGHIG